MVWQPHGGTAASWRDNRASTEGGLLDRAIGVGDPSEWEDLDEGADRPAAARAPFPARRRADDPEGTTSRADVSRAEITTLRIRDPRTRLDGPLLLVGVALLLLGPILGIIAYFMSHSTTNALQQRDALVLGRVGVSVSVVGAALFLRYSLAAFLRFWLARILSDRDHPRP